MENEFTDILKTLDGVHQNAKEIANFLIKSTSNLAAPGIMLYEIVFNIMIHLTEKTFKETNNEIGKMYQTAFFYMSIIEDINRISSDKKIPLRVDYNVKYIGANSEVVIPQSFDELAIVILKRAIKEAEKKHGNTK